MRIRSVFPVFLCVGMVAGVMAGFILVGGESNPPRNVDDEGVVPPEKISHVAPVYPEEAREAGIQGSVVVQMIVDESGAVESVEVMKSDPHFDAATIEAVSQWKYRPATLDGEPVSVFMTVTVNFKLH